MTNHKDHVAYLKGRSMCLNDKDFGRVTLPVVEIALPIRRIFDIGAKDQLEAIISPVEIWLIYKEQFVCSLYDESVLIRRDGVAIYDSL